MTISQTQEQCNLVSSSRRQAVPKILPCSKMESDMTEGHCACVLCSVRLLLFLSGFSEPALWWVGVCLRVIFGQHNPNWQWSSEPRWGADGENKLSADLSLLLQKCPYYCSRKVNFHFEVIYVQWCWRILCNPQYLLLFCLKWQLDKNNWSLNIYLQSPSDRNPNLGLLSQPLLARLRE